MRDTFKNYFGKIVLASAFVVLLFQPHRVSAHVQSPQQVVDDKYIVQMLVFPDGTSTRLQISFWDKNTGKSLTMPISYRVKLYDKQEKFIVFRSETMTTKTGTGEYLYKFLPDTIYPIGVEFEKADEPNKIYTTKDWWLKAAPAQSAVNYQGVIILVFAIVFLLGGVFVWSRRMGRGER